MFRNFKTMRYFFVVWILCMSVLAVAQNNQTPEQIRKQMQQIRQNTNWDDPAAAKKANEEIQKLAKQLSGGQPTFTPPASSQPPATANKPMVAAVKTEASSKENLVAIASRFYNRTYKTVNAIDRSRFDQDYKKAAAEKFSLKAVHRLTSTGGILISLSDNPDLACLYFTSAVKAMPNDTLSVNNFGGYLRLIDSTAISIPVLLYANKLFSGSPIIFTQLGNSYFELGDYKKAESYYKQALTVNPDFGHAHSSLCDLYIKQNRLQDAILELFAGVKNMGCSYSKASNTYAYLQQQSEKEGQGKEQFWNETKKHIDPADALAPLVPDDSRVEIKDFPIPNKVEDWLEGGGYPGAVQAYQSFHAYLMSFNEKFLSAHKMTPALAPGAVLKDYPDARLAIDCITERFFREANDYHKEYQDRVEMIIQGVNDAKELYINNLKRISDQFKECWEGCGGNEYCMEECKRKFCRDECPNANKFNDYLRRAFLDWRMEFDKLLIVQRSTLDDLYGFALPWLGKIQSPYWSLIYAYEIKSVALAIAGNCYGSYPQAFQALSHNDCGTDCSVFANPAPEPPEEVNKKDPKNNNCQPNSKDEIALGPCSVSEDCESWEIGCAAGVAFSFKRNRVKKTQSIFFGAGLEGGMGGAKVGGKFGGEMTFSDDGSVDGGLKGSVSGGSDVPVQKGAPIGVELEYSVKVMGGLNIEATKVNNPIFK